MFVCFRCTFNVGSGSVTDSFAFVMFNGAFSSPPVLILTPLGRALDVLRCDLSVTKAKGRLHTQVVPFVCRMR